jgi:hypothetical protein
MSDLSQNNGFGAITLVKVTKRQTFERFRKTGSKRVAAPVSRFYPALLPVYGWLMSVSQL